MADDIWCRQERGPSLSFRGVMEALTEVRLVVDGDFLSGLRLRLQAASKLHMKSYREVCRWKEAPGSNSSFLLQCKYKGGVDLPVCNSIYSGAPNETLNKAFFFLKPLLYATGHTIAMALSVPEVIHSSCTVIKFIQGYLYRAPTSLISLLPFACCPLSWPRDPLPAEIWDEHFLHLVHLHIHGINVHLTITDNKPRAVPPFHQEKTTCFELGRSRVLIWLGYCCLPSSEVIFLKLFCLFISHVFTSFACSGLFFLLNGRWCFTWRKTFFWWIMQSIRDTICL